MDSQEFKDVADIRAHLPEGAVLLPYFKGSKNPGIKDWPLITYEDTQQEGFKVSLFGNQVPYAKLLQGSEWHRGNVGVSLGERSNGLCAIDVDSEKGAEDLLTCNEPFRHTLRTARKRGCQFWFRVPENSPRVRPIKSRTGEDWGELRGTGGMSVLFGEAKGKGEAEPTRYRVIHKAKAVVLPVDQINWPDSVVPPDLTNDDNFSTTPSLPRLGSCVPVSLGSCVPEYLSNKPETSPAENLRLYDHGESLLKDSGLTNLYAKFIGPKFAGLLAGRHSFLVQAMPFLYRLVAPEVAVKLATIFFLTNKARFRASYREHVQEAAAFLRSIESRYLLELSDEEMEAYTALSDRDGKPDPEARALFRICRDLALYQSPEDKPKEPLTFFASFEGLALRAGLPHKTTVYRIIRKFEGAGLVSIVEKGTRYFDAVEAKDRKATVYRWRVPIPDAPVEVERLAA